ncbi:chaperone modulator CbpM [Dehalobacterium formicoaceticum]|uniref:Chaperone modulator CbpM n=1 Tax=Dehalobacterium formicoaceticum TaxID=51515 RepID=A0ABT1Y2X4_9FIRM|nr:chaperone modulator CbpM [Dehalobacterium formicoaceticum]MCR6545220.1 chaperone modulator CbpM [Dehalobacterium formicoaceticum]
MSTNRYKIVLRCQSPGIWKERALTIEEAAFEAGVEASLIQKLLDLGLIYYQGRMEDPRISRQEVLKIQKMRRLKRDLSLNWTGAGLVLELLEEMDDLQKEIKKLKSWYGGE